MREQNSLANVFFANFNVPFWTDIYAYKNTDIRHPLWTSEPSMSSVLRQILLIDLTVVGWGEAELCGDKHRHTDNVTPASVSTLEQEQQTYQLLLPTSSCTSVIGLWLLTG